MAFIEFVSKPNGEHVELLRGVAAVTNCDTFHVLDLA